MVRGGGWQLDVKLGPVRMPDGGGAGASEDGIWVELGQ